MSRLLDRHRRRREREDGDRLGEVLAVETPSTGQLAELAQLVSDVGVRVGWPLRESAQSLVVRARKGDWPEVRRIQPILGQLYQRAAGDEKVLLVRPAGGG